MSTCNLCNHVIVPAYGPLSATILLVGESPNFSDLQYGRPFMGQAGEVLQHELARAGISFNTCRATNLWQHAPTKDKTLKEAEYELHFGKLMEELKRVKAAFFMGSELSPLFFGKSVSLINGCKVTSPLLPKNIQVAVASYNPAICLQRDGVIGDFRFAVGYFAELVKEMK
jgi:uracil-DNA glycosylase family 4